MDFKNMTNDQKAILASVGVAVAVILLTGWDPLYVFICGVGAFFLIKSKFMT